MAHFENEEKTEEPCKYVHHIARVVALCSKAYTSLLTTRMSEDLLKNVKMVAMLDRSDVLRHNDAVIVLIMTKIFLVQSYSY